MTKTNLQNDEDLITIGIDILPQASPSSFVAFAACVYDGSKKRVLQLYDRINLSKLVKLIRQIRPKYLASDNIYELVRTPSEIPKLCIQILPTKLVQVTGSPIHGFTPLTKLMREHDLEVSGKLTPIEAAKACAILSSKKLGYLVEPFEDETMIIVSRSRAKGSGGWSQARYGRLMDSAVKQQATNIEYKLRDNNFDYEKRTSKSKYGAHKVVFYVYAPMAEITKVFKSFRGESCRVVIAPINKERVEFIPLTQQIKQKSSLKRLIVGVDPGLTVGLSILDLEGKVIKVASFREASRGRIIREIGKYGKPTLVCTDVYPFPGFVEKIATTLNAKLYTPRSVMTVAEKNEIVRKLAMQQGVLVKNAHQRDALASAYRGYRRYSAEFSKIEQKYHRIYDRSLRDEIKDMVIKGLSMTQAENQIKQILLDEKPKKTEPRAAQQLVAEEPKEPEIEDLIKQIQLLNEQLEWERKKNSELYSENRILTEKLEELEARLKEDRQAYITEIQREKIVLVKNNQIQSLKEKIHYLEEELQRFGERIDELKRVALLRGRKGWVPLKVIKKFTRDEILRTAENYGLGPGDVVYILNMTGGGGQVAELLISYKIKAIIGDHEQLSYYAKLRLYEYMIPIANPEDVEIIRIDEIAVIKEQDLNKILKHAKLELERIEKEQKSSFLEGLLEEYKQERIKEIEAYDELKNKQRNSERKVTEE
ncbi:MAG: DUF460 domain-containing protein [Candidatus Heimdallarchaeaceae archaeon]